MRRIVCTHCGKDWSQSQADVRHQQCAVLYGATSTVIYEPDSDELTDLRMKNAILEELLDPYQVAKFASKYIISVVGGGALDIDEFIEAFKKRTERALKDT